MGAGPLAVRWLEHAFEPPRAGTSQRARVVVENAGTATWRLRGDGGVRLSYHWLDERGNPIVWDGPRTPLPRPVAPGERLELDAELVAPRPPGRYRLAFDLVEEHRFWFSEVGVATLELPVEVLPRIAARRLAAVVRGDDPDTAAALAAQEEPLVADDPEAVAYLVAGALPAPDWSRRILDAHAEGWAAVGGSVEPLGGVLARRRARWLAPWAPGTGRNPGFDRALLLPSLVAGLEPGELNGLPAYAGDDRIYDGRIRLRLRCGRRRA